MTIHADIDAIASIEDRFLAPPDVDAPTVCEDCEGAKPPECDLCDGEGRTSSRRLLLAGALVTFFDCPACEGTGRISACRTCDGAGVISAPSFGEEN